MARINGIQSTFSAGEISPRFRGIVNTDIYIRGLESLVNFLPLPFGGVTRRPGTKYIAALEDQTKASELIPFEFSDTDTYIIEMNDGSARFYRNEGQVLQDRDFSNGTFTSDISGWTDISSGTGAIAHDAGNGRLSITGAGAGNEARAEQSINYLGIAQYTVTLDVIGNDVTYKVGSTSGGTDIATGTASVGSAQTFTFTASDNYDTIYFTFEYAGTGTAQIDNISLDSPAYKIKLPYAEADLRNIKYVQSADVVYLVHPDYIPRKLVRYDNASWDIGTVAFSEPAWLDENSTTTTLTPSAITGSGVTITASSSIFASTDVGRAIRFKAGPDTSESIIYDGTGSQTNFDIPFYPQADADTDVILVDSTGARTTQTGGGTDYSVSNGQVVMNTAPATNEQLIVQPVGAGSGLWGWATITGYTSGTEVTVTVNEDFAEARASTEWRLGAWSGTTGYPRAVAFHEQRLWFGGTTSDPQTLWGSVVGDFEDFSPDAELKDGTVLEDGAVSFTIPSSTSETILWLSSQTSLLVGTTNSVHSLTGGSSIISALSVSRRKEQSVGSENIIPINTENEVVFIQRLKRKLVSVSYQFDIQGFAATKLGEFAEHLSAESAYDKIAYQEIPNPIIWVLREDGTLVSTTYNKNGGIDGWARHTFSGTDVEIEDIAVIPYQNYSQLWMVVKRTINGATKRYVEVMQDEFNQDSKEDAFFVDSGLTYSGAASSTLTGLDHLEGETVTILVNGSTHPDRTVSSGSVSLQVEATTAAIGLGYTSSMRTNALEGGSIFGSSQINIARVLSAGVRLYETVGLSLGYSSAKNDEILFRKGSDPMDTSPPLFTGDKEIEFPNGQELDYKVYVEQSQPLPASILAITYRAIVSDK